MEFTYQTDKNLPLKMDSEHITHIKIKTFSQFLQNYMHQPFLFSSNSLKHTHTHPARVATRERAWKITRVKGIFKMFDSFYN